MASFSLFKKNKINWVTLPEPNDTVAFFEAIKKESEILWANTIPDKDVYGFQIQQHTKWQPGLTQPEVQGFENALGFMLPPPLRNFYKTMNGLTKKGINLFGNDGTAPTFRSAFYSYPEDLGLIREQIDWVYESASVQVEDLQDLGASRIFPVCGHKFILVDTPGNPILSMYGDDIIYWAENLSKLLANTIFSGDIYNASDFESPPASHPEIKFWLD